MLREQIKKHLEIKGHISRMEAFGLYNCMDITTVIRDLRRGNSKRKPMPITSDMRTDPKGKVYARYFFKNFSGEPGHAG